LASVLVGLGFKVCRFLSDEEAILKSRFVFVVNFTPFVTRVVSRVLKGEGEPDAKLIKALYRMSIAYVLRVRLWEKFGNLG
jgi:hypothetical protein